MAELRSARTSLSTRHSGTLVQRPSAACPERRTGAPVFLPLTHEPLPSDHPLRYLDLSMGKQLSCTLRHAGKSVAGRALLERSEIIFRGDTRLKISFSAITKINTADGKLHVHTKDGLAIFDLGPKAAQWHQDIASPRSLVEKLGPKPGQSVSLIGPFPSDFVAKLKAHGAHITESKSAKGYPWIFLAAYEKSDLRCVPSIARQMQGATALWLVYPKGQNSITESAVRSAGLEAGLVDVKVVSFSATLTALKFVLPKSSR